MHYDPAMQFLVMQVGRYDVMTQSYDVLWQITVPVGTIVLHFSYVGDLYFIRPLQQAKRLAERLVVFA